MRAATGRAVDRAIAVSAFALVLVVFLALLARTGTKSVDARSADRGAARELVELLRAGERTDSVIDYTLTRTLADGRSTTSSLSEAHAGRSTLVRGEGTLDVNGPTRSYSCELTGDALTGDAPRCLPRADAPALPLSAVVRFVTDSGDFDVARLASVTRAGERARCFRLRGHRPSTQLAGLGHERVDCLTADGLIVETRVTTAAGTDQRVATRVQRAAGPVQLAPLLAGFEAVAPKIER